VRSDRVDIESVILFPKQKGWDSVALSSFLILSSFVRFIITISLVLPAPV
jgi:hypothetical protein